jgi:hypothetical protein
VRRAASRQPGDDLIGCEVARSAGGQVLHYVASQNLTPRRVVIDGHGQRLRTLEDATTLLRRDSVLPKLVAGQGGRSRIGLKSSF